MDQPQPVPERAQLPPPAPERINHTNNSLQWVRVDQCDWHGNSTNQPLDLPQIRGLKAGDQVRDCRFFSPDQDGNVATADSTGQVPPIQLDAKKIQEARLTGREFPLAGEQVVLLQSTEVTSDGRPAYWYLVKVSSRLTTNPTKFSDPQMTQTTEQLLSRKVSVQLHDSAGKPLLTPDNQQQQLGIPAAAGLPPRYQLRDCRNIQLSTHGISLPDGENIKIARILAATDAYPSRAISVNGKRCVVVPSEKGYAYLVEMPLDLEQSYKRAQSQELSPSNLSVLRVHGVEKKFSSRDGKRVVRFIDASGQNVNVSDASSLLAVLSNQQAPDARWSAMQDRSVNRQTLVMAVDEGGASISLTIPQDKVDEIITLCKSIVEAPDLVVASGGSSSPQLQVAEATPSVNSRVEAVAVQRKYDRQTGKPEIRFTGSDGRVVVISDLISLAAIIDNIDGYADGWTMMTDKHGIATLNFPSSDGGVNSLVLQPIQVRELRQIFQSEAGNEKKLWVGNVKFNPGGGITVYFPDTKTNTTNQIELDGQAIADIVKLSLRQTPALESLVNFVTQIGTEKYSGALSRKDAERLVREFEPGGSQNWGVGQLTSGVDGQYMVTFPVSNWSVDPRTVAPYAKAALSIAPQSEQDIVFQFPDRQGHLKYANLSRADLEKVILQAEGRKIDIRFTATHVTSETRLSTTAFGTTSVDWICFSDRPPSDPQAQKVYWPQRRVLEALYDVNAGKDVLGTSWGRDTDFRRYGQISGRAWDNNRSQNQDFLILITPDVYDQLAQLVGFQDRLQKPGPPDSVPIAQVSQSRLVEAELRSAVAVDASQYAPRENKEVADRLGVGVGFDVGKVRKHQEDTYIVDQEVGPLEQGLTPARIMILADGMGGHSNGEVAAQLASLSAQDYIQRNLPQLRAEAMSNALQVKKGETEFWKSQLQNGGQEAQNARREIDRAYNEAYSLFVKYHGRDLVKDAILKANQAVYNQRIQSGSDMGCTLVIGLQFGDVFISGHAGDSRVIKFNLDGTTIASADHSLVQRLIDTGQISESERKSHPQRNLIYKVIGDKSSLALDTTDVLVHELNPGEKIVMCSDGAWEEMDGDENQAIRQIVESSRSNQDAAKNIVDAANKHGGGDNITVIVAEADSTSRSYRTGSDVQLTPIKVSSGASPDASLSPVVSGSASPDVITPPNQSTINRLVSGVQQMIRGPQRV